MPIYDYKCNKCNIIFESIKPFDKSEASICPKCGKKAKKIFNPKNHSGTMKFILKGWGWANDGYSGVSNYWKTSDAQRKIFNADGTMKSKSGDKRDWKDKPIRSFILPKKSSNKPKSGTRRIKTVK